MDYTSLQPYQHYDSKLSNAEYQIEDQHALLREKWGVMGGFLLGLLLVGLVVAPILHSLGLASLWAHLIELCLVIAYTWMGYRWSIRQ